MAETKNLSNPFSTGGGGFHFEAHVQASFVALMLTGGYAPCLPCWPVGEVKLQGKIEGFDTDDLIVFVENANKKERWKMLGQIKHSIAITQGSTVFGEVMQAAWNDFNKPELFSKGKDIITLITGPLSATDEHNVQWLLNQAKHTKNAEEFFRNVQQAIFSPSKSYEKLKVIQYHLKAANGGNGVPREDLYSFLNHFYLLDYDLGNDFGVVLSLLYSHISQFQHRDPQWVWARIVEIVRTWNKDGGTITPDKLPEDLLEAFKIKAMIEIPEAFKMPEERPKTDLAQHPDATYLALAILIGAWDEKTKGDIEILAEADWVTWGSLNDLLPTLAEVAPDEFIKAVENALRMPTCPFAQLFEQEGEGTFGRNYLTGLLWALEGLAWDEQYLVRVCVILGELASRDPGGRWTNRPSNSLATIFLPWHPHTLASFDKRKVAVEILLKECPDVAWNLIIQLLPGQQKFSFGSNKPKWREVIPDDREKGVTKKEYWQQVSFYAELAVKAAGNNIPRLSELIDYFDRLPKPAFDQLIEVLPSQTITGLPEDQRLMLWEHLRKFIIRHRRFSDAKRALSEEQFTCIEKVSEKLAPTNPFHLYQHLFADRDFDLYEKNSDWEEQRKILKARREAAVMEIFQKTGIEGVIRFAVSVVSAGQVGHTLGVIADEVIEQTLLPSFLDTVDIKRKDLVSGFIWSRFCSGGWKWCDDIDKSEWTPKQIGHFLACMPFTKEVWDRASQWLQENQDEYWSHTGAHAYQADGDLAIAIEKLIEYGRPHAAISCLSWLRHAKQPINVEQCVQALLAALSFKEEIYAMDRYHIVELIKFLQSEPSVTQKYLFKVEWAYLPLLDRHSGADPKLLESMLAGDPEFFCEAIRMIYRSKKEKQPSKEPTEATKAIADNAWQLLYEWRTPPGTQEDGTFNAEHFNDWLQRVKYICIESGHLEVALIKIGEVLIHAPPDPDGLWVHRAVATALNEHDAEDIRDGYSVGIYNSRGAYCVDPTGKPEKELAEQFRRKSEEVENAGFQRFAFTLRVLAARYEREAERIINEYRERGDD